VFVCVVQKKFVNRRKILML